MYIHTGVKRDGSIIDKRVVMENGNDIHMSSYIPPVVIEVLLHNVVGVFYVHTNQSDCLVNESTKVQTSVRGGNILNRHT